MYVMCIYYVTSSSAIADDTVVTIDCHDDNIYEGVFFKIVNFQWDDGQLLEFLGDIKREY